MANSRLAIVVPGCTDVNRGDQALVWESVDLLKESGYEDVVLLESGSTEEERQSQMGQTQAKGHRVLAALLPHPRRGQYHRDDAVQERRSSWLRMAAVALYDFLQGSVLLSVARYPKVASRILRGRQRETYLAFTECSMVAVKGGGFLHAYGSLSDPYLIWYHLFYIRLALKLGKPVVVLPNSFGPFRGRLARYQIGHVLRRCQFVASRESVSAIVLQEVTGLSVPVYPDLGYYLTPADEEKGRAICREYAVPIAERTCVGLTLRPYRFPGSRDPIEAYKRYLAAFVAVATHIQQQGMHPVFVTHVAGPSAHEDDRLAIQEAIRQLPSGSYSWIDYDGDARDMKAVYGCLDFLIGTRFHSVVFAQAMGVPCIAVGYGGNKATGIMGDMGLDEYVVPIDEVSGPQLCRMFDRLIEDAPLVRLRMAEWNEQADQKRQELVEVLSDDGRLESTHSQALHRKKAETNELHYRN